MRVAFGFCRNFRRYQQSKVHDKKANLVRHKFRIIDSKVKIVRVSLIKEKRHLQRISYPKRG